MAKSTLTAEQVVGAVVALFLEKGADSTASEIAEALGCRPAAVNRVIAEGHGLLPGLCVTKEQRASYSRDYPAMQSGYHSVWVYGPTRATLRKIALEAQAAERLIAAAAAPAGDPSDEQKRVDAACGDSDEQRSTERVEVRS